MKFYEQIAFSKTTYNYCRRINDRMKSAFRVRDYSQRRYIDKNQDAYQKPLLLNCFTCYAYKARSILLNRNPVYEAFKKKKCKKTFYNIKTFKP